jgi:small conductance mechanosensitive channel
MLLLFRPFKVGDAVKVAGQEGVVDAITLFSTTLDTADNRRIIIPNAQVFGSVIENQTHHELRVATITVRADLGAGVDVVRDCLVKAATNVRGKAPEKPAAAALATLEGAQVWAVSVWCKGEEFLAVRERLLQTSKEALDRANLNPGVPVTRVIS